MKTLQKLVGLAVRKVEKVNDYIQIVFSDSATLSIFNNYHYDGENISKIKGKKIKSIEDTSDKIAITFEGSYCLFVYMNETDYNGPEAMVLKRDGEAPVVWN